MAVSTRKLVGKVPLSRLRWISGRQAFPGTVMKGGKLFRTRSAWRPRSRVQSPNFKVNRKEAQQAAVEFQTDVDHLIARYGEDRPIKGLNAMRRKEYVARVLEILRFLKTIPVKPHVVEVAAALGLAKGITRKKLGPYLSALYNLSLKRPSLFLGSTKNVHNAVDTQLLERIDTVLDKRAKIWGTDQLAKRLKVELTHRNVTSISTAINILRSMGLAEKPLREAGAKRDRVVAARHRFSVNISPADNALFQAVDSLAQGPKTVKELEKATGLPNLSEVLVRLTDFKFASMAQPGGNRIKYMLTPKGRSVRDEQLKREHTVSPRLRQAVESPRPTGRARRELTKQAIKRWANLILARRSDSRRSFASTAKELGMHKAYAYGVREGKFPIVGKDRVPRAKGLLLELATENPKKADEYRWVADNLASILTNMRAAAA